jgi:SAM-dependent methyltransferase
MFYAILIRMTTENIILLITIPFLASFAIAARSFAPWVPCRKRDLERIFRLAELKPGETFYDLGCGDGKTIFYAGKTCGTRAIGVELAFPMYAFCQIKNLFSKTKNITFKWKNLFKEDLKNADVVFVFGTPPTLQEKFCAKIKAEMKPGSRLISYVFPVVGLIPIVVDKPSEKEVSVYLYRF